MGGCVRYTLSVTKEEVNISQHTLHIYKDEKQSFIQGNTT